MLRRSPLCAGPALSVHTPIASEIKILEYGLDYDLNIFKKGHGPSTAQKLNIAQMDELMKGFNGTKTTSSSAGASGLLAK